MRQQTQAILDELLGRLPELNAQRAQLIAAYTVLERCFSAGGKLLVCGNGGSAADAEHIVGELMKGFKRKRQIPHTDAQRLLCMFPEDGAALAAGLQRALPAVCLSSHTALTSAFANDVSADMAYAQQVYGLGRPGDALLGISTSGNARNVLCAAKAARAFGMATVALAGGSGGLLAEVCDTAVIAPANETYRVQEYHLPIYHALCAMLEEEFYGQD